MTFRLGVASLGVAGLAYVFSPLTALFAFLPIAVSIGYSAYVSATEPDRLSLPPT